MAEASGLEGHELVSLDFRCGSQPEVQRGPRNVRCWGSSRRNQRESRHPNDSRFSCLSLGQCQLVDRQPETALRVTGSASTGRYIRPETMADKPLFNLDAEGRWRLAYDRQQWVLQRRRRAPRRSERAGIADSGWRPVSFIGSTKATLARVLGEKGVVPAKIAEAVEALVDDFTEEKLVPAGDGQRRMNRK